MSKNKFLLLLAVVVFAFSCSREEPDIRQVVHIKGQITVDEELDDSFDYSGIELISRVRTDSERTDTLFFAQTDQQGYFSGDAYFERAGQFPVVVSRNNNVMGILNLVFADRDTIQIHAKLPQFSETVEIQSRENEIFNTFERVDRSFTRVANFINAGMISADSVGLEIDKWSDIYWEVFEEYPGTYAAQLSGESSISILREWNDSLMIARTDELLNQYNVLTTGTREVLIEYYAETEGLDSALQFINRLQDMARFPSDVMEIEINRIELLFDSSRTEEAITYLEAFQQKFSTNSLAMEWAEDKSYDLEFLAPGYPFPELSFYLTNGDSLHTSDLNGQPFLIEVTRLDNTLYQQQFDRTIAIYQIYRNFGLEIITVPLGTSRLVLDAFFSEREKLWHVAEPGSFDAEHVIEVLNLNRVPTRYLVGADGTIIRRYIGNEYDDIVRGLQQISTLTNE
ncbi:MAG: hypothetical protein JJU37_15570 [Balneolaceae bacterium]|nr:hypothetical protein [Balneolaceae bacterium]